MPDKYVIVPKVNVLGRYSIPPSSLSIHTSKALKGLENTGDDAVLIFNIFFMFYEVHFSCTTYNKPISLFTGPCHGTTTFDMAVPKVP